MKENDEFALNNEEYEDDARAVKESELLPIFEAMDFSGDIQPLDDFEISEPVMAELQPKKKSDGRNADRSSGLNKKTIPIFSDFNKLKKLAIIVPVVLVIAVLAALGINYAASGGKNTSPVGIVYSSDRKTYLNLENNQSYEILDANDVRVSSDGMKVYYSKNTTSRTGKYDIKLVNVGKKSSLKREGSIICTGVDEGWSVNEDGSFLAYSVTKSGVKNVYIYSAETGKSENIASDVEEVFLPPKGDAIYFTRRNGAIYSLHRMRYGEDSQNVASGIDFVKYFSSEDGFELLYTVGTGNETNVDVYSVTNFDKPVKVCSDVSEVYLNDYVYGGNLYYFKQKTANVNWEDFIEDPYRESDASFQKPVESDYMTEYGFIFKRYVLDRSAFEAANAKYKVKLQRDAIREVLDEIDFGLAVGDEYDCYVYTNYTSKLLASGVSLKNIISFSPTEAPRLVFRRSVINAKNSITMEKLVELAEKYDASYAGDYVRGKVSDSFKLSDDCIYAWYDSSNVNQYSINQFKSQTTQFYPASKRVLYVLSDGKLYCNTVSQAELKSDNAFAKGVSECEVHGGFIYYKKALTAENASLYRYCPETGEQHICDSIYSYAVLENDSVLAFSKELSSDSNVIIGVFDGTSYRQIDTDVSLSQFAYNGNSVAYVKNIGSSDISNAGDMCVYVMGEGSVQYSSDVTGIVYIKDNLSYSSIQKH